MTVMTISVYTLQCERISIITISWSDMVSGRLCRVHE